MKDFRLLETMRVSEDGTVYLLDRHVTRLQNSARHFGFKMPKIDIPAQLRPGRLRLLLSGDGECELEWSALPSDFPQQLRLSKIHIDSHNPFLYHKTTNRGMYGDSVDVILTNERGELTETPIANIAVCREGHWVTPPVSSGLLPGTLRAELLDSGEIIEGVVNANELVVGETIRCFNSLRGILAADYTDYADGPSV